MASYACMECGRKFRTVRSAERASMNGCPGCGGVDIDLDVETPDRGFVSVRDQQEGDAVQRWLNEHAPVDYQKELTDPLG